MARLPTIGRGHRDRPLHLAHEWSERGFRVALYLEQEAQGGHEGGVLRRLVPLHSRNAASSWDYAPPRPKPAASVIWRALVSVSCAACFYVRGLPGERPVQG